MGHIDGEKWQSHAEPLYFVFMAFSKTKHIEEEMESEKEEDDSSDEEEDEKTGVVRAKWASMEAGEAAAPAMTRMQARELRRVKKMERGWLSGLLDCWAKTERQVTELQFVLVYFTINLSALVSRAELTPNNVWQQ